MSRFQRTWREHAGERVEGTWRHVFIHNFDTYYLADLKIYADGMVDCWGLVTFEEFRGKVASGWVATTVPGKGRVSSYLLGDWRVTGFNAHIDGEHLIGEVRDEIDRLAGRPDSSERCLAAVDVFLADPDEENRTRLRKAYLDIPEHLRMFVLGDMDTKDGPLRAVIHPVGTRVDGRRITDADHARALAYFEERRAQQAAWRRKQVERQPPQRPSVIVPAVFYRTWPADPGTHALLPEFPRPVRHDGVTYPHVHRAFWTLALADPTSAAELDGLPTPYAVARKARELGVRPDWADRQLAVMATLLRTRFTAEPDLADLLRSTGDARIFVQVHEDDFWGVEGENWLGRLLELIRSELA